jgi:hypothetical protein
MQVLVANGTLSKMNGRSLHVPGLRECARGVDHGFHETLVVMMHDLPSAELSNLIKALYDRACVFYLLRTSC